MTYHAEVAKEYLREAFHRGTLDITDSIESLRGFVQIFAGEMDALVAIDHCTFLSPGEQRELLDLAQPTAETVRQYSSWLARARA